MAIDSILGNRIDPLYLLNKSNSFEGHVFREIHEKSRKSNRNIVVNFINPNKLINYRLKQIYKDFIKNVNTDLKDFFNDLRKQIFPHGNYITTGNIVNIYGK